MVELTHVVVLVLALTTASISLAHYRLRKSRERLAESEQRNRSLIEGVSDLAIVSVDPDGYVTSWNLGAERIKGYRASEIIGQSFEIFYTADDRRAGIPGQLLKKAAEESHAAIEGRRVRKDGSEFWAEVTLTALRDTSGTLRGFSTITQDATERRARAAALADNAARNSALLDAASEAIVSVNSAGEIVTANLMTERLFGHPKNGWAGTDLTSLLPEQAPEWIREHLDKVLNTREPLVIGRDQHVHGRRRDGTQFPVEVTFTPVISSGGTEAVAFISDISLRHLSKHALRQSEERFRATFENAAVGMAHVGIDGQWLRVNPRLSEILGYTREELFSLTFQEVTHPDDLHIDLAHVTELLAGKINSYAMEKRYIRKNGSSVWVQLTVSLIRDNSGAPQYFIAAVEEIAQRKQMEAALDRRISQQEAVADLGVSALAGASLQELFDQAVDAVSRRLGVEFAEVLELLPGGERLIARSCVGWQEGKAVGMIFSLGQTQAGYAIRTGIAVIAEDIHSETRFEVPENLLEHGIVSGASVVITGPDGTPFGVLGAHAKERRRFTAEDVHFLRGIANVLASAITSDRVAQDREQLLARATGAEREATTILESISDAFCAYDSDWRLTYANAAAESLLGSARSHLIGRKLVDVYPPFVGRQLEPDYATAMEKRKPVIVESQDSQTGRWLEVRVYPAATGGISVYFRDITDRKRAEQHLREAEEHFRTLANAIPQMAWVADKSGNVVWFNDRWYQYTGMTPEQTKDRGWRVVHHPDYMEETVRRYEAAIKAGTDWEDTFPLRGRNGQYRWFLTRARPVRDEAGRIARWLGTNTDITAQRGAELAMRDSQERLRAAVEASGTGTFRWDLESNAVTWDQELDRMFGVRRDEAVHTLEDFLGLIHPADRAAVISACERSISEGVDFEMEFRTARSDGHERWIYDRGRVFFDTEGRPSYMTGGCLDITTRKRGEAVLRRSNDDLRQFAWAASHDLQEPLRMVTAYTQLLERKYSERLDDTGLQYIAYAVEAARRMENLLRSMRAYWQASADAERPVLTPVDAGAALDNALHNLATTIAETGAQITSDPLPVVLAQDVQLVQLFQNVVGNALKYRHPDTPPQVRIWAEREDGHWLFSIRDNGIGIAPEYAKQVFGIFKRLHTQQAYTGTGIGLALCQKVVEALGGRIWVESDGNGNGSTFRFTLPAVRSAEADASVDTGTSTVAQPQ